MTKFHTKNIECVRRNNILFDELNLAINDKELLQINGANGSGKSTLLQIFSGLTQPTMGEVLWNNKNINDCRYEFQSNILYLGHKNSIKATLTVEENMEIMHAFLGPKLKIDYSAILEKIGMKNMNDTYVANLSAGQKRRIGLTRLFMSKSKLWFLDEPFNALDKDGKTIIEDLVIQHCIEGGMTIFTTHQEMEINDYPIQKIHLGNKNV